MAVGSFEVLFHCQFLPTLRLDMKIGFDREIKG